MKSAARLAFAPGSSQNLIRFNDKLFFEGLGGIADSTLFDVLTYEFLSGDAVHALTDPQSVVITDVLAKRLFGNDEALTGLLESVTDCLLRRGLCLCSKIYAMAAMLPPIVLTNRSLEGMPLV